MAPPSDREPGLAQTFPSFDEEDFEDPGLAPGTTFGRYSVVRRLGVGGMGAVYEALHLDLEKRVALKTLHAAIAANPASRARFLREGQAASKLRHAHVVDVFDVGVQDGVPYLVMEFLEGEDLAARVARGPMTPEEIADVMLPVASAVSTAHEEGIVHRDLKPENIFLARTRHGATVPKVLDFGISKMKDGAQRKGLTVSAAMLGTPCYMAPEQVGQSRDVDARADQYALGVILYRCATGRLPFDGETLLAVLNAVAAGDFAPPRALRPDLPEGFEAIVVRAMKRAPAERFGSVHELGRALFPYAGTEARVVWERVFGEGGRLSGTIPPYAGATFKPPATGGAGHGTLEPSSREMAKPASARHRRRVAGAVGAVAALGLAAAGWRALQPPDAAATGGRAVAPVTRVVPSPQPSRRFRVAVRATPERATLTLDDGAPVRGSIDREVPLDGAQHTLRVRAEGYSDRDVTFRDEPPPEVIELIPLEPAASAGDANAPTDGDRSARRRRRSSHNGRDRRDDAAAPAAQAPAAPRLGNNAAPVVQ